MKLVTGLVMILLFSAACSAGCSGEETDMTSFANPDLGESSPEVAAKLAKPKNILKNTQKDVPPEMEFVEHKYKDYFSISFPKSWGNVHVRDWLANDTFYVATVRDPGSGASFTLHFKPLQDEFTGKMEEHVDTWLEQSGKRDGIAGKVLRHEFIREQIHHYDGVAYEFMSDKNGTKYAGYAASFIDYRDEFRFYGMADMDKYPDYAKIFKKITKSFKLLKHYYKPPARKWRKK
ncbi:MAG: hypothetical protein ACYS8W_03840 [Planctomycetota bacterium]|jgi:hypothetical protein